jgi:hypothetical protein
MTKAPKKKRKKTLLEPDFIEFVPADELPSSAELIPSQVLEEPVPVTTLAPATTLEEMPPVFRELAAPKLPELAHATRARLLMQTPNRLYFYWSVGSNPFQKLNRALGSHTASYTLVLKLVDLKRESEQIYPVDAEGSWWFDAESDSEYRAEIGFYAPNRPYVRALFSNTVTTPRTSPSPRVDTELDWSVSADRFAQALEVAGFSEDAFEVALAGDDPVSSETATRAAAADLVGASVADFADISAEDIRHALLLLASGFALDALRFRISPSLFAIMQERADRISSEGALGVLKDRFDIEPSEITEEEFGPAVFGASSINFPKRLKTIRKLPKLSPVSSPGLR